MRLGPSKQNSRKPWSHRALAASITLAAVLSSLSHAEETASPAANEAETEASVTCTNCGPQNVDIYGPTGIKLLTGAYGNANHCVSPRSLIFKTKTPKGLLLLDVMTFLITQDEKAVDTAKLEALRKNRSHLGAVFVAQENDLAHALDMKNRFLRKLREDTRYYANRVADEERQSHRESLTRSDLTIAQKTKNAFSAYTRSAVWSPPLFTQAWDEYIRHIRPYVKEGVDFSIVCGYTHKNEF